MKIAVPLPTGRRILHTEMIWRRNNIEGPFTNEDIEDTKTLLRILPLLLCLFGHHLAEDGYSAPETTVLPA